MESNTQRALRDHENRIAELERRGTLSYTKGTFIPEYQGTVTPGSTTYTVQEGFYTRIGRVIHTYINLEWSATTASGYVQILELPFAASPALVYQNVTGDQLPVAASGTLTAYVVYTADDTSIILTVTGSQGLTVREVDGSPSATVDELVFPNGSLAIVGTEATYTPTAGGLTYDDLVTQMKLSADTGITKDGSDLVSQWDDQGVYISNVTQSSGTLQPLWVASSINSQPVVRFDGVDNYLYTTLRALAFSRVMVTLVIKPLATETAKGIFSWSNAVISGTPFILFQRDSTNIKIYVGGAYQWTIAHANSAAKLYVLEGDGLEWRLWVDGTAQTPAGAVMTNQDVATTVFLGAGFNGYSNSEIAYAAIRNGFMTSANRTTYMNAIKTVYGL